MSRGALIRELAANILVVIGLTIIIIGSGILIMGALHSFGVPVPIPVHRHESIGYQHEAPP